MSNVPDLLDELSRTDDEEEFARLRKVLEAEVARSHDPVWLWRLGQVYRKKRFWQDAERLLRESIKWGPSTPEPYRDLGLLYIYRDDVPSEVSLGLARDALEQGALVEHLSNDPSPITQTLLGRVLESLGDSQRAEAHFRKALDLDAHYEEAQYNLAMVLDESRKDEKLRLLYQSVTEDPEYFIAVRDLGFELLKSKRLEEAEQYLNRAMDLEAHDISLQWYLGQLKWMQNDMSSAESYFKQALKLDLGNAESHRLLGRFYHYRDRPEEANRELFTAIELSPDDDSSLAAYANFLQQFENREFAASLYAAVKRNSILPQERLMEIEKEVFAS